MRPEDDGVVRRARAALSEGRPRARGRNRLWIGRRHLALAAAGGAELARAALPEDDEPRSLLAVAEALGVAPPGDLEVRLGAGRCHLAWLPWVSHLSTEERWSQFARSRIDQIYGEAALAWDVRTAPALPGSGRIAVAWSRALKDIVARGRAVRSVRVDLLHHLDALLEALPDFTGCLTELDDDGASIAFLLEGEVRRLRWSRFRDAASLRASVSAEWAALCGELPDPTVPDRPVKVAIVPPLPGAGTLRALAVSALAEALATRAVVCLPEATA